MSDDRNPALPRSKGAFLAEEWSINPGSTLPSFVEMVMIADASRSSRKTLHSMLGYLESYMRRVVNSPTSPILSETILSKLRWYIEEARAIISQRMYGIIRNYSPEVRCLAIYLIERQCLASDSQGSSSESIYGAIRSTSRESNRSVSLKPFTQADRTRLALTLALGPYLVERISRYHRRLLVGRRVETMVDRFLLHWPMIQSTLDVVQILTRWRYLVGRSYFFDVSSTLLKSIVRRRTLDDAQKTTAEGKCSNQIAREGFPRTAGTSSKEAALALFLATSVFLGWATSLRAAVNLFRRASRQSRGGHPSQALQLLRPPPVRSPPQGAGFDRCLLCEEPFSKPAAISSGFVFCLECIVPYLRKKGKCPISGAACAESSVVLLFEPLGRMG